MYHRRSGHFGQEDSPYEIVSAFFPLLFVPVAFSISQYAAQDAAWAERYARGFAAFIAQPVSSAVGVFPFSIAEILLVMMVVSFVITMLIHLTRGDWLRFVAYPLALAAIFYSFFAGGWGVAYSREPYAATAGLTVEAVSADELETLCIELVHKANALREGAAEDRAGVYLPKASKHELLRGVQDVYDQASASYPWLSGAYGNPKPLALSVPLSYLNISGIFIPYTLEANVNMNNNAFMIPVTACHEAAHLRGWAREDEANYIAYAVCVQSDDRDFAYSGALLGLMYAGNALYSADSGRYWAVRELYSEGVARDLQANTDHWKQYEGKAAEVHEQVNDAYLKANRQEDGVRSYGRMVDLMVAEMRGK